MKHFLLLLTALAAAAVLAVFLPTAQAQQPSSRPNILLVVSDDHSAAFMGCYGDGRIKTPNSTASPGKMRFDRAYVASPQCVPSRAAFMTGRSPVIIGMTCFSATARRHNLVPRTVALPRGLLHRDYRSLIPPRRLADPAGNGSRVREVRPADVRQARGLSAQRRAGARTHSRSHERLFQPGLKNKPWFLQVGFGRPAPDAGTGTPPEPHDPKKLVLPPFFPDTPALREDLARYYTTQFPVWTATSGGCLRYWKIEAWHKTRS